MQIKTNLKKSIPFLTMSDVFDKHDEEKLWDEIKFLSVNKLKNPEDTSPAMIDGEYLKKNSGVFLDHCYKDRSISNYLSLYKKVIVRLLEIKDNLVKDHLLYESFFETNNDSTLLNYYDSGDYYKPHKDWAAWTFIYWTYKTPKRWSGGEFLLNQLEWQTEAKKNCAILFPSFITHEVKPIQSSKPIKNGHGRYAITTLFRTIDI